MDMTTANGRFSNTIMAAAAELYRIQIGEKVRRKYEAKKKRGEPWGRKPKEFDVEKARELRKQGLGYRAIAAIIGGVSYQTVRRRISIYNI